MTKSKHRGAARPGPAAPAWVYGQHTVRAALANPARRVRRLVATAEAAAALGPGGAGAEVVDRAELERLLPPGAVHQGLAAVFEPLPEARLDDILATLSTPAACVLVLDQVTDPQNVGAVLRSAAAFGAAAVVVQERHSPPLSGALLKAASGGAEAVPLCREVNLARALDQLKESGFWCLGLDAAGAEPLAAADLGGRAALVLGAEGTGLRRLTRDRCDLLVRIPIGGAVDSLNVSASAAVALYEWARRQ